MNDNGTDACYLDEDLRIHHAASGYISQPLESGTWYRMEIVTGSHVEVYNLETPMRDTP